MNTPLVLFIFKRPQTTQKVFDVIRQARPKQLLVLADAPRKDRPDEAEKCAAARAIIDQVDWDCEIIRNYAETNRGVGNQFATGLAWVFEQVERAIILEDDCVVDPTFFPFADELLDRYQNDPRIFTISAQNVQPRRNCRESYYFSRYPHIWGWATWRRAWQHYDYHMKRWEQLRQTPFLKELLVDSNTVHYWTEHFENAYNRTIQGWDYQWTFASWLQGGLSIIPNVNMVQHIGFGEDSTHFQNNDPRLINPPPEPIAFPLVHPPYVLRNVQADAFTELHYFEGGRLRQLKRWTKRQLRSRFPHIQWKLST